MSNSRALVSDATNIAFQRTDPKSTMVVAQARAAELFG